MSTRPNKARRNKVSGYVGVYRSTARGRPFEYYYLDEDGKARFVTCRSARTAAEAAFERLKAVKAVEDGRRQERRNGRSRSITVAELAAEHLARPHLWQGRTADGYERAVRLHLVPALGRMRVCDLTTDDFVDWVAGLRNQGYTSNSVIAFMRPPKAMLKRAVREGLLSHNPIDYLEPEEGPGPGHQCDRVLQIGEVERLFREAKGDAAMQWSIMFGVLLGPRRSELLGLDWARVDFEAGMVEIRGQLDPDRKSNAPKTRAGVRRIRPLYDDAFGFIDKLSRRWRAVGSPRVGAVIRDPEGELFGLREFDAAFAKVRTAAGLERSGPDRVTFHTLRHTYASMLARDPGATLLFIQHQLGHATLTATQRYVKFMHENPFDDKARARLRALVSRLPVKSSGNPRQHNRR